MPPPPTITTTLASCHGIEYFPLRFASRNVSRNWLFASRGDQLMLTKDYLRACAQNVKSSPGTSSYNEVEKLLCRPSCS